MFDYRISKCVNGYYWLLVGEEIMIESSYFHSSVEECIQHLKSIINKFNLEIKGGITHE